MITSSLSIESLTLALKMKKYTRHELEQIFHPIIEEYGGNKIELDYTTSFQLLSAVILSAQTTDKQVNRITPPFFERIKEP